MQDVKVNKADLLKRLEENRGAHRAIFERAQEKYREKVISLLDQRLHDAREGYPIVLTFGLPEPVDYTGEYDAAISMIEWEVEETVSLDEQAFRQLVLNEWRWTSHFVANSASYLAQ